MEKNVFGEKLHICCTSPMTGYFRDGSCRTIGEDIGTHTVCAIMTDEFLSFSASRGNDLITPAPHYQFPGLKEGDRWCLCALRWKEAYEHGFAPKVYLKRTNKKALTIIDIDLLKDYAIDLV